jgi:hypothetical protein
MLILFFCLLTLHCPAEASSSRTIHLADGDMQPIYVESGFSTLLKFSSHPEPGLIGDQDGFKVEYMKNIVAIKPLIAHGKTNLFVFTKEGQFNFQIIAGHGHHDNVVYIEPKRGLGPTGPTTTKTVVMIDELFTRKVEKSAASPRLKLTLNTVATPQSRSTIVLRIALVQTLSLKKNAIPIPSALFSIQQGAKNIKIENIFLESKAPLNTVTTGLILVRAADLKKNEPVKLTLSLPKDAFGPTPLTLQIPFSADFPRK